MAAQRTVKGITSWLDGRGLAIAVVVPLSLASFLLGYFVGKATTEGEAPQVVALAVPGGGGEAEAPPAGELTDRPVRSEDPPDTVEAVPFEESAANEGPSAENPVAERSVPGPPPQSESPASPPPSAPVPDKPDLRKRMPYSVQIAAFQNRRDAEALQRKCLEKGYNAYVLQTRTRERKTVYKVRVGRFEERKDAELLALKLKTLEGMTPFVTGH